MEMDVGLSVLLLYLAALLTTAWVTLLERKYLAGSQVRKGPNKVSVKGVLQPIADAVKLFCKEQHFPAWAKGFFFFFSPVFSLGVTLAAWHLWPFPNNAYFYQLGLLLFVCVSSVHVYVTIAAGWGSQCVFSVWGAARGVSLAVSYEIPFVIVFLCCGVVSFTWDLSEMVSAEAGVPVFSLFFFSLFGLMSLLVMELNRAPFDLIEAESELVSGFNTEYSSTGFVLLFLAEYAQVVVGCLVLSIMLGSFFWGWVFSIVVGLFFVSGVLLARASYPRVKVDTIMESCWKSYLPGSLLLLLLACGVFF